MIKKLFKNKSFLAGSVLLLVILTGSIVNTQFFEQGIEDISKEEYFSNKPSPPSWEHPFGTGKGGIDLFDPVLNQTLPTIKMALFVTAVRMLISLSLGFIYCFQYRWLKWLNILFEGFNFVPATLLSFLILYGLNFMDFEFMMANPDFRWYFISFTLIFVGIPPLTQLIGQETRLALQNEFITSSKVLGGSRFFILKKHIIPTVRGKFLFIFNGELIAVLTLMMHVSILGFFIPGWTAFIGSNYFELMLSPWVIFFPVLLFTMLIISISLITSGIRNCLDGEYINRRSTVLKVGKGPASSKANGIVM
jgi:peptide/nickel transport system permease protein